MTDFYFVILLYFCQLKYWWLLSLCVLANRIVARPLSLLALLSPIYWLLRYHDSDLPQIARSVPFSYNTATASMLFGLTLTSSFALYWGAGALLKRIDPETRHPLFAAVSICSFAHLVQALLVQTDLPVLAIVGSGVAMFTNSTVIMMAYDFKDTHALSTLSPIKRFALLHGLHNAFFPTRVTQVSPCGVKHLVRTEQTGDRLKELKVYATKIMVICVLVKFAALLLGHFFLGIEQQVFVSIGLPQLKLIDLATFRSIPIYFKHNSNPDRLIFYFGLFARSLHWIGIRYVDINTAISFLMFIGFAVDLGVLNPFRSVSLADFYRRVHVYIALFYRTFIFPTAHRMVLAVPSRAVRKTLSVWIMLFFGGIVFQTMAHPYQLVFWSSVEIRSLFFERVFYYALLATEISASLFLESHSKNRTRLNLFMRSLIYLALYNVLISWPYSFKSRGYSAADFLTYLRFLIGLD